MSPGKTAGESNKNPPPVGRVYEDSVVMVDTHRDRPLFQEQFDLIGHHHIAFRVAVKIAFQIRAGQGRPCNLRAAMPVELHFASALPAETPLVPPPPPAGAMWHEARSFDDGPNSAETRLRVGVKHMKTKRIQAVTTICLATVIMSG